MVEVFTWHYLSLVINSERYVTRNLFVEGYLPKAVAMQLNCFSTTNSYGSHIGIQICVCEMFGVAPRSPLMALHVYQAFYNFAGLYKTQAHTHVQGISENVS
jgi:hypothetical protein